MAKNNEDNEEIDRKQKKIVLFDELEIEKSIEESYISDLEESTFYPIYQNIKAKQSDKINSSFNSMSFHHKSKPKK